MDSCAGTSSQPDSNQGSRKLPNLTVEELRLINNVYHEIRAQSADISMSDAVGLCSSLTNVSVGSVYCALKSVEKKKTKPRGRKRIGVNDDVKYAIRRKFHEFYFKNEIPTRRKIHAACAEDKDLRTLSRNTLLRTMYDMNFCYLKRSRRSVIIEKNEIVVWRREYLEKVIECRTSKTKMYYLGETWINKSLTISKTTGLSTGTPPGKEPRLIVTHIGSESGFLDNGLHVFQRSGDCHEDMDSEVFEKWFASILPHVEPGAMIVMDSTPCRNRLVEKLPSPVWRKGDVIEWLNGKHIEYKDTMLKVQLLAIVQKERSKYEKYRVDEMAKTRGVTVLRLPPYHCELNPIQLIWVNIKNYVAQNNKTFKLGDVKVLLQQGINRITAETWKECILCVRKEEERLWDLDTRIEAIIEPLIVPLGESSGSDSDSSN